jgi:hypothetical protein
MDELGSLREMRVGLPPAPPQVKGRARALLLDRIREEESAAVRRRTGRLWQHRRLLVAGIAMIGAALLALAVGILGGTDRLEPAAAQVLREAARVAARQAPLRPGPEQYLFTRSKKAYLLDAPGWSVLVPGQRESWISLDGSRKGRIRERVDRPRFLSPDQRAGWIAAGRPALPRPGVDESTVSGGGARIDETRLPRDPAKLRGAIEARSIPGVEGPPGEAETFVLIGDLLRESYLSAAVRSALLEAAAELPGVESLGEVEDPLGRPGIGVAFTDTRRAIRHELILDPRTSALLGERESTTRPRYDGFAAPIGTTVGWAAYLESKVVDSVGRDATRGAGSFDDSVGCYEGPSRRASIAILHGRDPIAICARLWREGVIGGRLRRLEKEGVLAPEPGRHSPHLVACTEDGTPALVFPGQGPQLCRRLGLSPLDEEAWAHGR